MRRQWVISCGILLGCVASACSPAAFGQAKAAVDVAVSKPETVGFSSQRLENLHALMQKMVDDQEIAGIVTVLARHGKVIDYRTYGDKDVASKAPMTKDTIFRDFSMTKPVTAVSMMILYEQGKWLPSDPIAKYIPEFAHLKVFKGVDGDGKMILVEPDHAPTMAELMTHTAGFTYGFFGTTPVDKMYVESQLFRSKNLQEMIDKIAKIPLLYQPGTRWTYSVSMDIQGYIVEKLSGKPLPEFMAENIFKPLGMKDAAFYLTPEKAGRLATLYLGAEKGIVPDTGGGMLAMDYSKPPTLAMGGAGLVSTAEDYYKFAQMLANKGELNGVRIISPASVELMSANHLAPTLLTGEWGIGPHTMRPGFGYGYNCAVIFDPAMANLPDGKGTFFWDGAAGTWFWVDPTNDVVFVAMIQRMWGVRAQPNVEYLSRPAVYGALVDRAK